LTLDKYQFEPAGVFILDAPEEHAEKISDVTKFVSEKGGSWKYWRGSLSVHIDGQKANVIICKQMKKEAENLLRTFNYIVSVKDWEEHTPEEKQRALAGIPDCIYDLTKDWLAYATYGAGKQRRLLVRQSLVANTWRVVEDPIGFLGSLRYEGGLVLDYLDAKLAELHREGVTRWGIHAKLGVLDFTRAFTEFDLPTRILDDRRYYKELVPFTNDPNTPAEAYFPRDGGGNMAGTWDAWARFETQIPPALIPTWRAAIRGIIDARNKSRQIIYLYDQGYTAKSQVASAIHTVMEGLSATLDEDALNSSFWFSGIYGARFINLPDVKDQELLDNPKIKRITGGDYCRHEGKGDTAFDTQPNCRLMAEANAPQKVDITKLSELLRFLFFPLQRNDDPDFVKPFVVQDKDGNPLRYESGIRKGTWKYKGNPQYQKDLIAQFWDYMVVCEPDYNRLCPTHGDIAAPEEMLDMIAEKCATGESIAFLEMIDNLLEFGKDKRLSNLELRAILKHSDIPEDQFTEIRKKLLDKRGVRDGGAAKVKGHRCLIGVGLRPGVTVTMGNVTFAHQAISTSHEDAGL
jgi:hypothetical protein